MKLSPQDLYIASRLISLALLMAGIVWGSVLLSAQVQQRGASLWTTPLILIGGIFMALWLGWRELRQILQEIRKRSQ